MPVYRILILGVDPLRVIETTIRCHEAHPSPNSPGVPKYGAQSLVPTREALDRTDFDAILVQTDKNGGMVPSSEPGVTRLHFARVDLSCPREGKSHRRRSERDFVARVVRTRRVNQFRRAPCVSFNRRTRVDGTHERVSSYCSVIVEENCFLPCGSSSAKCFRR